MLSVSPVSPTAFLRPASAPVAPAAAPGSPLPDAVSVSLGEGAASPLMNYGLPRDVVIARRAGVALGVGAFATGTGECPTDPWALSIASRYIGNYETPNKAVAVAMSLTA